MDWDVVTSGNHEREDGYVVRRQPGGAWKVFAPSESTLDVHPREEIGEARTWQAARRLVAAHAGEDAGEVADTVAPEGWRQVDIPLPWRPSKNGEVLHGFYGGQSVRDGIHGEYTVILVLTADKKAWLLSGTEIVQLVAAAQLRRGDPVHIVWGGRKETAAGFARKHYDLYVPDNKLLMPDIEIPVDFH